MVRVRAVGAFPHPVSASISMLGPRRCFSSVFVRYIILIDTVNLNDMYTFVSYYEGVVNSLLVGVGS